MTHRLTPLPLVAAALLAAGCGVVSSPPKAVEAPPPVAIEAPPPKAVGTPAPPPGIASSPKAPSKANARPAPPVSRPAPNAPPTVSVRAPPPLDLKSLEQRLKASSAIGVLTKLSLKNQVDDLVAKFRAFHAGQRPPGLVDLRPSFELLLMKVLSLLQDKDAGLAKDIEASRGAIWQVLTDRDKLASYS
jgi:hypothetical protein